MPTPNRPTSARNHRLGRQIRAEHVRVVDDDCTRVLTLDAAIAGADADGLDVVEIAAGADGIPVVKVVDYGRWSYEQAKAAKARRTKPAETKQVKVRPGIAPADLAVKVRTARSFLDDGHRVRLTAMLRGRGIGRPEQGVAVLADAVEALGDVGRPESEPQVTGRDVVVTVVPLARKTP